MDCVALLAKAGWLRCSGRSSYAVRGWLEGVRCDPERLLPRLSPARCASRF